MKPTLNVYALPNLVTPEELKGDMAVVVDVLRATTTITSALAAGAQAVIPCLEVADALAKAEEFAPGTRILGGERHGSPIAGFDLGNSPEEYTPEQVADKTVIFTTTNGTRALGRAQPAAHVFLAAFVNLSAVVQELLKHERIHILCAGTDGQISEDDVLLAGALVERLQRLGITYEQNTQAITAREYWLHSFALPKGLGAEPLESEVLNSMLRTTRGAQNLLQLGLGDDILAASQIDRFTCVPRFDTATQRITIE